MTKDVHVLYRVNWDNGSEACGTFPYVFNNEQEADEFGSNWAMEMSALEPISEDEEGYTYEVIEDECQGCEKCCTEDCLGCAYCYEENDPRAMGWVDSQGRP